MAILVANSYVGWKWVIRSFIRELSRGGGVEVEAIRALVLMVVV